MQRTKNAIIFEGCDDVQSIMFVIEKYMKDYPEEERDNIKLRLFYDLLTEMDASM